MPKNCKRTFTLCYAHAYKRLDWYWLINNYFHFSFKYLFGSHILSVQFCTTSDRQPNIHEMTHMPTVNFWNRFYFRLILNVERKNIVIESNLNSDSNSWLCLYFPLVRTKPVNWHLSLKNLIAMYHNKTFCISLSLNTIYYYLLYIDSVLEERKLSSPVTKLNMNSKKFTISFCILISIT